MCCIQSWCVAATGGVFFFEQLFNNVGCQNGLYIFYAGIGSQMFVASNFIFFAAAVGVFCLGVTAQQKM